MDREFARYLDALKKVDEELKASDEWTTRGDKLAADGKFSEAEQAYRKALDSFEFSDGAHYGLGKLFEILHKYDKAEEEYSIVAILKPENKEVKEALTRVRKFRAQK